MRLVLLVLPCALPIARRRWRQRSAGIGACVHPFWIFVQSVPFRPSTVAMASVRPRQQSHVLTRCLHGRRERCDRGCDHRADAGNAHKTARDVVALCARRDFFIKRRDPCLQLSQRLDEENKATPRSIRNARADIFDPRYQLPDMRRALTGDDSVFRQVTADGIDDLGWQTSILRARKTRPRLALPHS